MFDKLKQVLLNLKNNISGGVKNTAKKVINATPIANPTANNGNNFWSGKTAKGMALTQDFFQKVPKATKLILSRGVNEAFNPYNRLAEGRSLSAINPQEKRNYSKFITTGADIVNQGLKNWLAGSTLNLVQPKMGEAQTTAGKVSGVVSNLAGALGSPAGKLIFGVPEAAGAKVTRNTLMKVAPKLAGTKAARIIPAIGAETTSTALYAGLSKLGSKLGLNDQTDQFSPKGLTTNVLMGMGFRSAPKLIEGLLGFKNIGKMHPEDITWFDRANDVLRNKKSSKTELKNAKTIIYNLSEHYLDKKTLDIIENRPKLLANRLAEIAGTDIGTGNAPSMGIVPTDEKFFNPSASSEVAKAKPQGEILYHGTNATKSIDKQGLKLMPPIHGSQIMGEGIYLTPTKEEAANFGKTIYETTLKPGVKLMEADPGQLWKITLEANTKYPDMDINKAITKIVKEKGFDGLKTIGAGNKGETYISVFDPTDIIQTKKIPQEVAGTIKDLKPRIGEIKTVDDVVKILGQKPYVSGSNAPWNSEGLGWKYKDKNGIPQDVPEEMSKILDKENYKPFKLNKVTKTSNNLYHTTPSANLESIRRNGLTTGNKARFEGVSGKNNISFSANEAGAKYYSGNDDVMIRTKASYKPKDLETDLLAGGEGTYITHENIPPEMLEVKINGKWQPLSQSSIPEIKTTRPKPAEQIIKEVKMGKNQGTVPLAERTPGLKQNKLTEPIDQLDNGNVIPPLKAEKPKLTKPNTKLSSEKIISPGKIRGFAETVMADKSIAKEVREFAATQTYEPLTNKETLKTVSKIIKRGDSQAISFAKTDTGVNGNATAMIMLRKLIDKGRFDEADDLIESVSPRFTKQGQEIQILSQFSKLKPEGAVRYAQRLIEKANEANPKLKLKLTPENTKLITDSAKAIEGLVEGSREQQVAISTLLKNIHQIVPPSIGQKISTIQTMSQLLNLKTPIRNVLGNTIFSGMENVSDTVGSGVDLVTSFFTGNRSKVLPSLKAQGKGLIRGAKEGLEDIKLGIDTSGGIRSQYEIPNQTFTKGILSKAEKALGVTLRVPDRASFTAAYEGSLNNQMRAAKITKATPEMIEIARADGMYRTFQDNSKLAQVFSGAKKLLNKIGTPDGKFGLGDLILKYPKTPANILSRGLDYSPAGFVKGIYEATRPLITGKAFNQKSFVESISRSMVGSGVIAAAYILAKKGIVTGKAPNDYDVSATQQAGGGGNFKINVSALKRMVTGDNTTQKAGDKQVSYDWAQPTSLLFSIGADLALNGEAKTSISDAIDTSTQTLTNQSLVKGLTNFAGDIKDKGVGTAVAKTAFGVPSSFTPSILNQFASLFDKTGRSTYSPDKLEEAKNKVFSRIPGLRNTLEPSIDVFGQEKKNYESSGLVRILDVMFNPAFVTTIRDNPAAQEVLDIYYRSGETKQAPRVADKTLTINGEKVPLSAKQYSDYQKIIGTKTQEVFDGLLQSKTFQDATDTQKAKIMSNALTDINAAAKKQLNLTKATYKKSKDAPEGIIDTAGTYGKAVITDPVQTIKAVLNGNPVRKVEGGAVILERQEGLSKLDKGDKSTQVDHKIALTLGGTNDESNLQVLSNEENKIKGQVETYLYNEMKAGRITKKEAQKRDLNWRDEIDNLPKATQKKLAEELSSEAPTDKNKVYELINEDTGNITIIDLSKPIEAPKLTGMAALDKKLKSSYSSAITTRINNVTKLYKDGQLSAEEANKMIEELTAQKNKATGKGGLTKAEIKKFKTGVKNAYKSFYTARAKNKLPELDDNFFKVTPKSSATKNSLKKRRSFYDVQLSKPRVQSIPVEQLFKPNAPSYNISKARQLVTSGGGVAPSTSSLKLSRSSYRSR